MKEQFIKWMPVMALMDFGNNITIRRLFEDERPATLDLAWSFL